MNFLLETTGTTSVTQWILPAVLLILVVGIFVLNYFRSKKNQEGLKNMVNSLKVGDHVKTYSGFYGKIIEIVDTTDGKVAVLETGSEKNKGIFSIDINAIYAVDEKKPVVLDANGNVINPDAPVVETDNKIVEADKKDEKIEEKKEIKTAEPVPVVEKKVKKTIKTTKTNPTAKKATKTKQTK